MKNNNLNIWPDITGYIPAIIPFILQESRGKDVKLLFNHCNEIDSTGLNLLLLNVLQIILKSKNIYGWTCKSNIAKADMERIKYLGFFKILTQYSKTSDLFWCDYNKIVDKPLECIDEFGIKRIAFPILVIPFEKFNKRREALLEFKSKLYCIFEEIGLKYNFSYAHFISIINEIVKNSADHTDSICMFGLDIIIPTNESVLTIKFSIGDLGLGINENTKNQLNNDEQKRYKFWDLTQTYRKALKTGYTSRSNSEENRGIGMSIVINGAKNIGMRLLVFDAKSSGIISEINVNKLTHKGIRENFFSLNRKVGFYYYGELTLRKKNETN